MGDVRTSYTQTSNQKNLFVFVIFQELKETPKQETIRMTELHVEKYVMYLKNMAYMFTYVS